MSSSVLFHPPRARRRRRALALGLAGALAAGGALSAAGPAAADSVPTPVATIAVGNTPTGIALTPTTAYVANIHANSVSVINTATNAVTSTIAVGSGPQGVAVTPDGSQVFTANQGGNTVSAITTATGAVATIPVDATPFDLAVSPDGSTLYVSNQGADAVDIISVSASGDALEDSITGFAAPPQGIALSPDGSLMFVTLPQANEVAAFDAYNDEFINYYPVGSTPGAVAFSPDGAYAYVTNENSNTVSILNSSNGALDGTIPVGSTPADVAVSPDGTQVYVDNYNSGTLSVISLVTDTVATVAIGSSSQYVAASANGTRVYATNAGGNSVSVLGVTPMPTVTSVSPASGLPSGGNQVTITGTNLTGATVAFGTIAATGVSCSATSCTATAPAASAGTVNVQVTTPAGASATTSSDRYTYGLIPAVTGVSPNGGGTGGGYRVTITGTGLSGATSVAFGGATVSNPSCTATTCTVQAPNVSNTGTVNVTVTSDGIVSPTNSASQFTYESAPTITAISPVGGPTAGGNTVTITGTNLAGAGIVQFQSGHNATNISCTSTSCTLTAPAGTAGNTSTTVTLGTPAGTTTSSATYSYADPATITNVSPASGSTAGGIHVVVTGTNLAGGYIAFGANWSPSGYCFPTYCNVVVPAGAAGTVRVWAYTVAGYAAYNSASQFTYN